MLICINIVNMKHIQLNINIIHLQSEYTETLYLPSRRLYIVSLLQVLKSKLSI